MSIVVLVKPIKIKKGFDIKDIRKQVEKLARSTATDIRADYKTITKNWHHDVLLETELEATGMDVTVIVGTTDKIFKFLDEGTRVRYATMSPDFKAKTKVGRLSSTAGRGSMLFVSKRRPRPGIAARNWTPLLQKRATLKFQKHFLEQSQDMYKLK